MPENILVVEYEPRYTDRVRQALAGQPFTALFAKDGEEALRAIEGDAPRLIVLSSVVPKVSTPELIRAIRNRNALATTPILLTVSGYNGKSPKQDAVRMGASDILPKPYSESEFLGKVQQMLGVKASSPAAGAGLTSNEIFGDLLEEGAPSGARKTAMKPKDDVDKMLADTLAGMMPQRKTTAGTTPAPPKPAPPPAQPPAPPKATVEAPRPAAPPAEAKRTQSTSDLDKLLSDTLSGTRKPGTPTQAGTVATPQPPRPAPPPPAAPKPAAPPPSTQSGTAPSGKYITEKLTLPKPEKVLASQPVFTPAAAAAPAVEEEEPTDGVKFGQYVLLDKIATGGMAEVWKARMRGVEGFQKTVAIKKILPHLSDNQDFIEMFIDEAKLAAQLNHNNIIHIYDLGKIQSSYYIAMEYIDGYDLKSILKLAADREQPLSVELALFVASKIAAALDYAHRKRDFEDRDLGLVHRDVSPQNVLISKEGDIKLCDFGIAKAASKASHTQAGALKGKLQYMSPEQAWGRAIDKRSDIFALATVLFELLTGRKLFTGDNELSILEQVREARITTPSQFNDEVTPQIDAIVVKALQKDPANRYQTAGEMERDINQVLYTFKPTPTAADLAIYMHRLENSEASPFPAASIAEPEPVREPGQLKPFAAPAPAAVPAPAPMPMPVAAEPAAAAYEPPPTSTDKKLPIVPIGIAAAVVVIALVGWLVLRKPSAATPTTTTAATKSPVVPTSATAATNPAVGQANAAPALGIPPTATTATFDPAAVDAEVKKRLAAQQSAQQAKLDAETKKQQQQTQVAQAQTTRPTPQPVAPVPQPVVPAPQPVVPAPQPVAQQPVPQPVAPAPQPVEPQVARAREGDLIPAGTEGLNPPRMTRQAPATYPPVARIQRIEGAVLMSVLVSESGVVQDVRVIRGDPRLTEAAVQAVRRSGFSAGTKDGVRVKSWVPVTISFKL